LVRKAYCSEGSQEVPGRPVGKDKLLKEKRKKVNSKGVVENTFIFGGWEVERTFVRRFAGFALSSFW
jgi:hypothetical protein